MKYIFIIIALFSFYITNAQNNYNVNFDIKGVNSANAYITVFGDKDKVTINTNENKIDIENGKFSLSGTTSTEAMIRVSFGQGDERLNKYSKGGGYYPNKSSSLWVIIYPNANLDVVGSIVGNNYINIYPLEGTGVGENDILAKLNNKMLPLLSEQGDIAVSSSFIGDKITDKQKEWFEKRSSEINNQVEIIRKEFVNEFSSSIAALWLMEDMLIRSQIDPMELEAPLNLVNKKYYDNYFYRVVKDRVNGAKKAVVGANCPIVSGVDQFDNQFNIKDIKGKYIIIDFWGTWCGACLQGTPHMKEFRDKHIDKLQILGIANDKDVKKWKSFIEKYEMNWPNIMQGKDDKDYVAKFNVQGFPTKILISPKGKILYRASGESEEFYNEVEKIILNK